MPTDIASFGASGAVVVVVFFFLKYLREENAKNNAALEKLTIATDQNTAATKSADLYLRQRNGIDAEHHAETLKALKTIPKTMKTIADDQASAIIDAFDVNTQKVNEQVVEHQTVKKETKG